MRFTQVAVAAIVGALALSSCSGGDDKKDTDSAKAAQDTSPAGVISPADLPQVPKIKKGVGIISDIDVEDCTTDAEALEAHGTAKNSAKSARDIVVTVNWVTSTSDVVARGVVTLKDVEPGTKKDWSVEGKSDQKGDLICVPSALAGNLK